jgi:hypothetical protein
MSDHDQKEGFMGEIQRPMDFVGKLYELEGKDNRGNATGNLYWAGDLFLNPGLYMWNGEENVLLVSRAGLNSLMPAQGEPEEMEEQ